MPIQKLEDILSRLRSDDPLVLKELFQQHYTSICSTIHRFIKGKNLVEELAQNVFIRFWEKRHTIQINSSVPAYLRRMAINEAIGYLRKDQKVRAVGDFQEEENRNLQATEDYTSEDALMYGELKDKITAAIDELPPKCRAIFQLSRFEELTYKEIAERLDISVKTVENQMGKALKVLRQRLGPYLALYLMIFYW